MELSSEPTIRARAWNGVGARPRPWSSLQRQRPVQPHLRQIDRSVLLAVPSAVVLQSAALKSNVEMLQDESLLVLADISAIEQAVG